MNRTLEETKADIIEFAEAHKLSKKSTTQILENIKTDKNGLVSEFEYCKIIHELGFLSACRETTIHMLERNKQLREKTKRGG